MKKRYLIIIVIQSVIIAITFLYATIQKMEAEKYFQEAVRHEHIADNAKIQVEKLRAELYELQKEKTQSK